MEKEDIIDELFKELTSKLTRQTATDIINRLEEITGSPEKKLFDDTGCLLLLLKRYDVYLSVRSAYNKLLNLK